MRCVWLTRLLQPTVQEGYRAYISRQVRHILTRSNDMRKIIPREWKPLLTQRQSYPIIAQKRFVKRVHKQVPRGMQGEEVSRA